MLSTRPKGATLPRDFHPLFIAAWLLCAVFYFVQYALRSAPGVMVPELTTEWGLNALGLSSLLGTYFFTYAGFSIVAGASLDRYGAKWTVPAGIVCLAVGAVIFSRGAVTEAEIGRTRSSRNCSGGFPARRGPRPGGDPRRREVGTLHT